MINLALLSAAHIHTKGYLKDIAGRDDCRLVSVWDDSAERGRQYAELYDADFTVDLEAAATRADIDGFLICSENSRHLAPLEAALPAGKPIFCEKPFTTSVADATEALENINHAGATVIVGYFHPFAADMQAVARTLASGILGKVTHVRCRNSHHAAYGRWFDDPDVAWAVDPELAGGGGFLGMGSHAVHLLCTLLGPVSRVFATIANVSGAYPRIDDGGIGLLEFASGELGVVESSWVQTGNPRSIEITGSEATLYPESQRGYVTQASGADPLPIDSAEAVPARVDRLLAVIEGRISDEEVQQDLATAAHTVAVIEACYESSDGEQWVEVAELPH